MLPTVAKVIVLVFISIMLSVGSIGQQTYTISGRITDQQTREPLRKVSVIIRENKVGTVTDDSGYFKMTLRFPKFTFVFSAIGYVTATRKVSAGEETFPLMITLEKRANETLDEVVVTATKEGSKVKSVEMNVTKINAELIKRSPLVLGEPDIIKALALQPGITTAGEGAGGFSVRGGNTDQNLVLVDGAPLFNTSHLLGFFSSVTPDAIQDITLYKGSIPAAYGGRLSSLLNMKVKTGNDEAMRFITGIGPVTSRFFINGPIIKNKLNIVAGARAAYPDLLLNQLRGRFGESRAFFYDGIVKAEYVFNANNKLSATAYRSYDRFKFDTATSYDWKSDLVSLNFNSNFTEKLSFSLNGNVSRFVSDINNLPVHYEYTLASSIVQKQAKASLLRTTERNKTEAGIEYTFLGISPGTRTPSAQGSSVNSFAIQKEQGRQMAAFISDEIIFTDKITLKLGARHVRYDYLGPKDVYGYKSNVPLSKETVSDTTHYSSGKSIQNYGGIEPRASLKIGITDNSSFKLSYSRGQQFLHLISNTTAITPVDFWKLSDNYIKGQKGDQYSVGYFQNFGRNKYDVSVEVYYRTVKNLVDYKDGATLLLNPYIESALLNAQGRGYGAEFSLTKNIGKLTGQINYSYSRSEIQVLNTFRTEQVNNGNFYPANTDRPHNISLITKYKMGRGWSFNCNFVYMTGRPATYPDGNYVYNGSIVTNYSKRNMDRLPAYHRLDAGFSYVSRRYPEQKKYSIVNFSFYNVYMRENAYSIYFQRSPYQLFAYRLSVIGIIVPSISWTYNF